MTHNAFGVYYLQARLCPTCRGQARFPCNELPACRYRQLRLFPHEHDCATCRAYGVVVHAQAVRRPGQRIVRLPEDREHDFTPADAIAIVRRADRRKLDAPRLAFDAIEPALRALEGLRDLSLEEAAKLFPRP
jgi:hypothetical protein